MRERRKKSIDICQVVKEIGDWLAARWMDGRMEGGREEGRAEREIDERKM